MLFLADIAALRSLFRNPNPHLFGAGSLRNHEMKTESIHLSLISFFATSSSPSRLIPMRGADSPGASPHRPSSLLFAQHGLLQLCAVLIVLSRHWRIELRCSPAGLTSRLHSGQALSVSIPSHSPVLDQPLARLDRMCSRWARAGASLPIFLDPA
ncbi:uncharacterized protein BO88DRAFT_271645 [Aspergillus vadensis CBS 113365]|uniref:Uncharacterized protein n=1 Tax=Aspergillus vadensis (strain CBS 113365 / IMI 142717 / IBT 24658) TaxID=1448311 RepID=A0A319BBB8_ASPVC|nr:hypothetical protein BO88DRAFT_271645 [Aspergillus vadensis CBS 113365]PYH69965.1 hypothetical protein BO88DRAFT_271645 [Aspergillus vadensis CBS 113365]